jgi:hypothetical protein
MPAYTAMTADLGRRVTRTIKVADVPDWIDFPDVAQIAQLRRTVTDIRNQNRRSRPPHRLRKPQGSCRRGRRWGGGLRWRARCPNALVAAVRGWLARGEQMAVPIEQISAGVLEGGG